MSNQTKMSPVVDPEAMLPSVEKMIYSQCWKFVEKYPITFEEAKSEAYYAYVRACYDYKEESGTKFSTWCYYWVWTKLKDLITLRSKDPHVLVDLVADDELGRRQAEEMMGEANVLSVQFQEEKEDWSLNLSDDAKCLLEMILDAPEEILGGERPTPKQLMLRIKKHLMSKGRIRAELEEAQHELETVLRKAWAA